MLKGCIWAIMTFALIPFMINIGVFTDAVSSASYYVSPRGSDNNSGSSASPFRTIQKGCSVLKPGDTLYIKEGKYNEKLALDVSGNMDSYISIQNYGNDRVVLDGTSTGDGGDMILLKNVSYIRIKGLDICNNSGSQFASGIRLEGWCTGIRITGNRIYSISSEEDAHAIAAYGTNPEKSIKGLVIEGNEIFDCRLGSSEAIALNGNVEDFSITNNTIHDNDNIGIDCIGFEGTAPYNDQARRGIVARNTIYNISSAKNPAYDGDACAGGIYVDGGRDIIIENNRVYNCDIGIEVASEHSGRSAKGITVRNNLIYRCGLYGLSIGGASEENGYAEGCSFLNNTLYSNAVGINLQQSRDNRLCSNIIYGNTLLEGSVGSNALTHNLWYSSSGNPDRLWPFADPKFINPAAGDFHIAAGSPAVDSGEPEAGPEAGDSDFDGKPRVAGRGVDCGAHEGN